MTARNGRKPLQPVSAVRADMDEAQRRYLHNTGKRIPDPRRSWQWSDAGVTITLHGGSLGGNPIADYRGPHGRWQAFITIRGAGKPWQIDTRKDPA